MFVESKIKDKFDVCFLDWGNLYNQTDDRDRVCCSSLVEKQMLNCIIFRDDDNKLAQILGHEIAHVILGHTVQLTID